MGGGTIKTAKKWIKYWSDKKSAVKKKAAARAAARNVTGGGIEQDLPELTDIEERIVVLMGGESFATGDRHLQIQPFNEPSPEHESPSILAPAVQAGSSTCSFILPETDDIFLNIQGTSAPTDQVINTADVDLSLGHRGQSQLMDRLVELEPVMEAANTSPNQSLATGNVFPTTNNSMPQQEHRPEPGTTRPSSSAVSTPRRRRRRILQATMRNVQASPPSQRRANFMSLAEKFLRLEQQRLEMDRRMVALIERNSERDNLLVEAVKAMGEGLKAVAEAIKR